MAVSLSPCSPQIRGPFKATKLWHTIIAYLNHNVEVKKRRHMMKSYDDCFTGSDAVSVILRYLLADNINFVQEISREKALKLCQLLMESHVFESVSKEKDDRDLRFEDSHTRFYRFLHVHGHSGALPAGLSPRPAVIKGPCVGDKFRINPNLEPDLLDGDDVISNPIAVTRQGQILQEIMNITSSYRRRSTDFFRSMSPAKLMKFSKRSSTVDIGLDAIYPQRHRSDSSAILKEAALTKLLTLVDLPVLDDILQQMCEPDKQQPKSTVIENTTYGPFSPSSGGSPMCVKRYDAWTQSALDCLEFHPKGDSILYTLQGKYSRNKDAQFKTELFTFICNHYSTQAEPLLPETFIDIHTAVLNLFMQCRLKEAVDILRLSFLILPNHTRSELERLLTFITLILKDESRLQPHDSNCTLVERHLTSSIIRNKLLSAQQGAQLVMLMVDHLDELFVVPDDVQAIVEQRQHGLNNGHSTPVKPAFVYCNQISSQEFENQQKDFTNSMLKELMDSVLDDTKLSLKEKQQKLKQFQKHYPSLHKKHFSQIV